MQARAVTGQGGPAEDLRGLGRLAVEAVTGVTNIVESLHATIGRLKPPFGAVPVVRAGGPAGIAYRSVRGVTRLVGAGLDTALLALEPLLRRIPALEQRDAVVAALNGVLGDHLVATANPLAIPMRIHGDGRPLALDAALADPAQARCGRVLLLLHGLCMNDRQWHWQGHDHGAALARDLGFVPLYLRYNSGLPVARNGAEFADLMQRLSERWPVPIERLVVIGHSMGGLVARSACHQARLARQPWLRRLDSLVCLGSPHCGAPLERAGGWIDRLLEVSPYAAPFARLGRLRSAGIQDLRHGRVLAAQARAAPKAAALPRGVRCFAVAASTSKAEDRRWAGDGLVPVASALGRQGHAESLPRFPARKRWVVHEANHFDLLHHPDVYARLREWLADA